MENALVCYMVVTCVPDRTRGIHASCIIACARLLYQHTPESRVADMI